MQGNSPLHSLVVNWCMRQRKARDFLSDLFSLQSVRSSEEAFFMPVSIQSSLGKAFPVGDMLSSTSSRQLIVLTSSSRLVLKYLFVIAACIRLMGHKGTASWKTTYSGGNFTIFFWISLSILLTKTMKRMASLNMTSQDNSEHYQTYSRTSQKRNYEGGLLCLAIFADAAARRSNMLQPFSRHPLGILKGQFKPQVGSTLRRNLNLSLMLIHTDKLCYPTPNSHEKSCGWSLWRKETRNYHMGNTVHSELWSGLWRTLVKWLSNRAAHSFFSLLQAFRGFHYSLIAWEMKTNALPLPDHSVRMPVKLWFYDCWCLSSSLGIYILTWKYVFCHC